MGLQPKVQDFDAQGEFSHVYAQNKEWFIVALLPHTWVPLIQENIVSQYEVLELSTKLEASPVGETSTWMV